MRPAFTMGIIGVVIAACNPFAPAIDLNPTTGGSLIGDQTTIDGIFQNIVYSYAFKDTTIYGRLLADDYRFVYRDYENSRDVSWGRDEEMMTTHGLFQNVDRMDVVWNNIITLSIDSADTQAYVSRHFNLSVTFNPGDIVRVDGYVALTLQRSAADPEWRITLWRDQSNF